MAADSTYKVRVLLTAEARDLRRALRSAGRDSRRLGDEFARAGGRGGRMGGRAQAGSRRAAQGVAMATPPVARLVDIFHRADLAAGRLGDQATVAAERARHGMQAALPPPVRLRDAFARAGGGADRMGRRVRGAGRQSRLALAGPAAQVRQISIAFPEAGAAGWSMARRVRRGGGRIRRSMRAARDSVRRLGDAFRRGERRAGAMGVAGAAAGRRIRGALGGVGAAFGLAGGAFAAGAIVRQVGSIETRMERLGIQAQRPREEMEALRALIYDTANAPDINVDPSQITGAVEAIVEKTGDLDFARRNIRLIAEAIQGSGGTGDAIGRMTAEFRKLGIVDDEQVRRMLNLLVVQGKSGAFTLENMSAQGERLFSAFAGLGYHGPGAVAQLGAIVQMARQATGSSEQATTATEALLRTLSQAAKLEKIETELGVRVRRDDGKFRDLDVILADLLSAVGNDVVQLSEIFDAEAARVLNGLVRPGGMEDYREFLGIRPQGGEIAADAARVARTMEAQAQSMRTSAEDRFAEHLTGPLRDVAITINTFKGELVAAGAAAIGLMTAFKIARATFALTQGAAAATAGTAAAAATVATAAGAMGPEAKGGGRPRTSLLRRAGGKALRGLPFIGAAFVVRDIISDVIETAAENAGVDLRNPVIRVDQLSPRGTPPPVEQGPRLRDVLKPPRPQGLGGRGPHPRNGDIDDVQGGEPWTATRGTAGHPDVPVELAAVVVEASRETRSAPPADIYDATALADVPPPSVPAAGSDHPVTINSTVRIETIRVQSDSADPKVVASAVAREVADEIERRQRDQSRRLESAVNAGDTPEVEY